MLESLRWVWGLMAGRRLRFGLALLCLAASTALNYGVPLIASAAIDIALAPAATEPRGPMAWLHGVLRAWDEPQRLLAWAAALMAGVAVVSAGLAYLKGRWVSQAADGIARDLKDRLFDHLQRLPQAYHDRAGTGDLVQRCTSDVETTRQFLTVQVMEIGNAAFLILFALPCMLALDGRMTVTSLLLLPLILGYAGLFFGRVRGAFKQVEESEGALTAVVQENLTGIRVVRAFARQAHEQARFDERNAAYRDNQDRMVRLMSGFWAPSDLLCLTQLGLVLFYGAVRLQAGALSVGELFAFFTILNLFLWPVRQIGRVLTDLGKAGVALGRIGEILKVAPESPGGLAPAEPPAGAMRFAGVRFAHREGPAALNGVDFAIAPGETVALLGPSGAGKSTLIHLLLRLYDDFQGEIELDGRPLRDLDRAWVRRHLGVVLQEPFLFSRTLRDNIRLGRGQARDEEIHEAARAACIHETITGFEAGYDTRIGERGITLSGGQRQRVAIARALLADPAILVLDDALSAVDGETEQLLLDALRRRRGRRTTIVIAHRLSTLRLADRMVVLEHGRVSQIGTHAELVAREGLYRKLWTIQTQIEEEFSSEQDGGRAP